MAKLSIQGEKSSAISTVSIIAKTLSSAYDRWCSEFTTILKTPTDYQI